MTRGLSASLIFAIALAASTLNAADDDAMRAIVNRAIAAQGGEAKLAKFNASTAKFKGTLQIQDQPVPFTGDVSTQGADQQHVVIDFTLNGMPIRIVHVLNRDKGWIKFNETLIEMDADKLAEAQEEAYGEWVATLLPLKDKEFKLSSFGEAMVEGRAAVGVNVSRTGHRDGTLFFDKESHRLVKTISRVKDDAGQEVTEETVLGGYREVDGIPQAMTLSVKRDGKPHADLEVTEVKLIEKLDDGVFAQP